MTTRRARRTVIAALTIAGWWAVSCREIPAPEGGVMSLSAVQLASPGMVAGDTLRDSTGAVAPLRVTVYGFDGEPLDPQPAVSFVVLDSVSHLAGALLIGDTIGTTRVVAGAGSVQTQPAEVKVTLAPAAVSAVDSVLQRPVYSLVNGDTVSSSGNLGVKVVSATGSAVEAVIVRYFIDKAPTGTAPTVVLVNGNARSDRDTSGNDGVASRVARLRLNAISNFTAPETVSVRATASHRGSSLGAVTFTIIYTKQP